MPTFMAKSREWAPFIVLFTLFPLLNGISGETRRKKATNRESSALQNTSKSHSCASFMDDTRTGKRERGAQQSRMKKPLFRTKHKPKQNIELKNSAWEWTRILLSVFFFCFCAFSAIRIFCADIKMSRAASQGTKCFIFPIEKFFLFFFIIHQNVTIETGIPEIGTRLCSLWAMLYYTKSVRFS